MRCQYKSKRRSTRKETKSKTKRLNIGKGELPVLLDLRGDVAQQKETAIPQRIANRHGGVHDSGFGCGHQAAAAIQEVYREPDESEQPLGPNRDG